MVLLTSRGAGVDLNGHRSNTVGCGQGLRAAFIIRDGPVDPISTGKGVASSFLLTRSESPREPIACTVHCTENIVVGGNLAKCFATRVAAICIDRRGYEKGIDTKGCQQASKGRSHID